MEKVIKRDGSTVPFDKGKIVIAIEKAMADTDAGVDKELAEKIANRIQMLNTNKSVEEIQDLVESSLMCSSRKDVARAYIIYRDAHAKRRDATADQMRRYNDLHRLVAGEDEESKKENSNKDTRIIPTMRDYLAGFTCRELATDVVLPKDIAEAHKAGIIHFHDSDYSPVMPMTNCFHGTTRFVTDKGIRAFNSFNDGAPVRVVSADGKWHKATVRCYGKQKMQRVKMHAGRSVKEVICTANHRWVLKDGSITTNLQAGMTLYSLPEMLISPFMDNEECEAWAAGFCIGDGSDILQGSTSYTKARLCGDKSKYADIFKQACYSVTLPKNTKGDYVVLKRGAFKQEFLNCSGWRFMSFKQKQALFLGFYAADGAVKTNKLSTADDRIAGMVREISSVAGYYISSEKEVIKDTNYKKNARLI